MVKPPSKLVCGQGSDRSFSFHVPVGQMLIVDPVFELDHIDQCLIYFYNFVVHIGTC
ncbi:hypothetical protein TcasGA2_TC034889 [Tribolium castaneum]|uniref:Uncharacterized protein n=1 Tax=Tribolium castaneum TaxID=7070 RepID=A0A139WBR4_TRICA|nr:hypothetical protein TcasGA2_TC034889 [Tribolium castaneum]